MGAMSKHNDEGEGIRCPHCGMNTTDLVREYSSLDEMISTIKALEMIETIKAWFSEPGSIVYRIDMDEIMFGITNACHFRKRIFEYLRSEGIEVERVKAGTKLLGWVRI